MMLVRLESVDSTNEEARRVPFRHGLCIVADEQTGGRGRRGRRWLSKRGMGIYASFVLKPIKENLTLASLAFGWAVFKTLSPLKEGFYLKWPNDVYINGRKVAGILPELTKDRLIVGVGINLYYSKRELSSFPVPATSLAAEGVKFDREDLLRELYRNVLDAHSLIESGRFSVELFERNCPMVGREVRVEESGKLFTGKVLGIDSEGALIVETEEGLKRLFSGEVTVREEK